MSREKKNTENEFEIVKELVKTYLHIRKTIEDIKLELFRSVLSLYDKFTVRRLLREIIEEALKE